MNNPCGFDNHLATMKLEQSPESAHLTGAKQECREALARVIVRQTYPGARVSHIAGHTYRVNIFEQAQGIIPTNHLVDTFLVDVNDTVVVRRPEASKRLVKYSDRWTEFRGHHT